MNAAGSLNITTDPDDPAPATAWAYRRQARRLRWQFRDDPAALQCSLKRLSAAEDAKRPWKSAARLDRPVQRVSVRISGQGGNADVDEKAAPSHMSPGVAAVLHTSEESASRFAGLVSAMLGDEGILRHSRRQALLRQAAKLEIGPFEANLIIAAVEHRRNASGSGRGSRDRAVHPGRWSLAWIVSAMLAVEALGIGAVIAWIR